MIEISTLNLFEAIRLESPNTKMYQASSSEMFGNSIDKDGYQRETTLMKPTSPYGCAKLFAYNICNTYQASYGLFVSNGICLTMNLLEGALILLQIKLCEKQ